LTEKLPAFKLPGLMSEISHTVLGRGEACLAPTKDELESPIGHYQPEALVLAPETGKDENVLSLISQLIEYAKQKAASQK
jgi:hypothetical protein